MAAGIRCFALLISVNTFQNLPAFSQQNNYARTNLIARALPVQATLSHNNNYFSSANFINFESPITPNIVPDCGAGASAIQIRSGSSINAGSTVINAGNAVDNNISTYATYHIEGHQKDVEVSQVIAFTTTASATDIVKIYLSLNEILQNHTVTARAYYWVSADGSGPGTPVGVAQNITSLNVLPAAPSEIIFNPGVVFNRIKIGVIANSNGNHEADLNVHHVVLTPPPPTTDDETDGGESEFSDCAGPISLAVSNTSSDYAYKWYTSANAEISNGGLPVYTPTLASGTHIFYVSATKVGCTAESPKHKITVTVNPKPSTPAIVFN